MATYAALDIAQRALYHLGITTTLTDVETPGSLNEEIVLNNLLPFVMSKVTLCREWTHLVKRVVLTEDTDADIEGWEHLYDVPSDLGIIIRIEPTSLSARNTRETYRFAVRYEYDITGADQKLATDIAQAELVYTFMPTIATLSATPGGATANSMAYFEAMAAELAAQAAMPLLVDPAIEARAFARASEYMDVAVAADIDSKTQSDDWPEADGIVARF